jgi:hypothetical protein
MKFTSGNFKTKNPLAKINMLSRYFSTILISFLFLTLTFSSCKKTGPSNATIYVKDSVGNPVGNANVTLWQDTSYNTQTGQQSDIRVSRLTDLSGRADFEFSLEAYLNILAVKNGDTARGFIRLQTHQTVEKTVQF